MPLKLRNFGEGQVAALNRWADYIESQLGQANNTLQFANTTGQSNSQAIAQIQQKGGANGVQVGASTLTFALSDSSGPEDTSTLVVVGASWVTNQSNITASFSGATLDHPDPEDAAIEGIVLSIGNLIAGVSFEIVAYAPEGSRGEYSVAYIGR